MKEEILNHISDVKDIISVLPTNNKENREKKAKYIEEEEIKTVTLFAEIRKELKKRLNKVDAAKENAEIKELEEELKKCSILNEWSIYNTSFEKMHLDYYLYQLHRYYKNDLVNTNDCIRKILEAFKNVGIELTNEDFSLHPYVSEYVSLIQAGKSEEELSASFEPLYWKLPELLKTIELNFRYIYLKYEKKIDKYYENRHKEFLEQHTDKELLDRRKELIKVLNDKREKDKFYIYNKFKSGEYSLHDYSQEERKKKRALYFGELEYTFEFLLEFYQVLYDYNLILKYSYIFDDIKEIINNMNTLKGAKANALKQVLATEKDLRKYSGTETKKKLFKKSTDNPHNMIKFKEYLAKAIDEFYEYDKASFDNTLFNCFNDDFTTLNALELVAANYVYFVTKVKEHEENNDINYLSNRYTELKDELHNNNFSLLDKIDLLDEYQMKQVISDKYILNGVNLTTEQLEKDNISKTLNDIKILINYEYIVRSNIDLDNLKLYFDMRKEFD